MGMANKFRIWALGLACAGMAISQATADIAGPVDGLMITENTTSLELAWEPVDGAVGYEVTVLFNGELLDSWLQKDATAVTLEHEFEPGYYTAFVRAWDAGGAGSWSEPTTFTGNLVIRAEHGKSTTLNAPPTYFSWSRVSSATRYRVKLFKYSAATGQYGAMKMAWVAQSSNGTLYWYPPAGLIGNGKYKVQVTDFVQTEPGSTSSLEFKVKKPVVLQAGVWRSSSANKYGLSVTVNSLGQISGAQLTAYFNDGWYSNNSYTFLPGDITKTGSSFLAKKQIGVFNSAGDRIEYFEIAGTFQSNGSVAGTWKSSYYHKPSGMSARQNSKQGSFTAQR